MKKRPGITKAQKELLRLMAEGRELWMTSAGPEIGGFPLMPFYPRQKRTVTKLIELGILEYNGKESGVQRACGLYQIGIKNSKTNAVGVKELAKAPDRTRERSTRHD